MSQDTKPYVTISKGGAGYFAVILEWIDNHGGYWDVFVTGDGRYATEEEAIPEAMEMAECEGLRFIGKGLCKGDLPS